ncbi:Sepiapterin reductase [Seminavis robusta]|uniref:Sepiapterin reductase n=1 Tax=Seminavis robusta TaxID=568900 RepID=A0A9N8EJQ7_9STRA|nr:Sepiapterin reductase [Seminavis robusta]|eukprot:Sro1319_g262320.1 Sepiapterin reductase (272) ;mRNA; f:26066-26881
MSILASSASPVLLFATGASKGLGKAIAVSFAKAFQKKKITKAQAVLMARSCMDDTENLMVQEHNALQICQRRLDLADLNTLEPKFQDIWTQFPPSSATHALLINCAGTTGTVGPTSHLTLTEIEKATRLNLVSKLWVSSRFAQTYSPVCATTTIANISSMCSIKATPTMALYCATSAGRDIFHQVLAQDDDNNNLRVLNYAPGSCDTDMQSFLRTHDSLDSHVQAYCQSLETDQKLVDPNETADELVRRLLDQDFESGQRIEYTDVSTYKY